MLYHQAYPPSTIASGTSRIDDFFAFGEFHGCFPAGPRAGPAMRTAGGGDVGPRGRGRGPRIPTARRRRAFLSTAAWAAAPASLGARGPRPGRRQAGQVVGELRLQAQAMKHHLVLRTLDLANQKVIWPGLGQDRQHRHQPLPLRPHDLAVMLQVVRESVARFLQLVALRFCSLPLSLLSLASSAADAWSVFVSPASRSDCLFSNNWATMHAARAMPPMAREIARRTPVDIGRLAGTIRGTPTFDEAICWAQAMNNCSWVERSSRLKRPAREPLRPPRRGLHGANAWQRPDRPTPAGQRRRASGPASARC